MAPLSQPRQPKDSLTHLSKGHTNSEVEAVAPNLYRTKNRLAAIRKMSIIPTEPTQETNNVSRPFRVRPGLQKTTVQSPVENDTNNSAGQHQSPSELKGRSGYQSTLRRAKQLPLPMNGDSGGREESETEGVSSKPTRRTFVRKQAFLSTTPANVRVTKRYYKKIGSKVESTTIPSSAPPPATTEANVKPFRVATRHQGQTKQTKGHKTTKKIDEDVEGANYPEHFKLLLKNQPVDESSTRIKPSSPKKIFRASSRIDHNPAIPTEKTVHAALRSRITRPPAISITPKKVSPTFEGVTDVYQNGLLKVKDVNLIEDDDLYAAGPMERSQYSAPNKDNQDPLPPVGSMAQLISLISHTHWNFD